MPLVIPEDYLDPITHEIMLDPVFTADGQTYDREAIEQWLSEHDTSPLTGAVLDHKDLTTNFAIKRMIDGFITEHKHEFEVELRQAATNGDNNTVGSMLKLGTSIESKSSHGLTALHLAVIKNHTGTAEFLLNRRACIDTETDYLDLSGKQQALIRQIEQLGQQRQEGVRRQRNLWYDSSSNTDLQQSVNSLRQLNQQTQELNRQLQELQGLQYNQEEWRKSLSERYRQCVQEQKQLIAEEREYGQRRRDRGTELPYIRCLGYQIESTQQQAYWGQRQTNLPVLGQTALHLAATNGNTAMMALLLRHRAVADTRDQNGCTPFHIAVLCNRVPVAELLMEHHANPKARDNQKNTARDLALCEMSDVISRKKKALSQTVIITMQRRIEQLEHEVSELKSQLQVLSTCKSAVSSGPGLTNGFAFAPPSSESNIFSLGATSTAAMFQPAQPDKKPNSTSKEENVFQHK